MKQQKVVRSHLVPDAGRTIYSFTPSPDGKTIYVLTNRMKSLVGLDIDTGEVTFRADFNEGDIRRQAFYAFDISRDGKELYVYQLSTQIMLSEYRQLPTRIAVYDTASGLEAEPVRSFKAPRRIHMVMKSTDDKWLYAVGFDIYKMNPATGEIVETLPLRNWKMKNRSLPDVLDFWPLWDQTDIFSTPVYSVKTDKAADDPEAYKTGLLTLDLKSGKYEINDFENTSVLIFSTVVSPDQKHAYGTYTQLSKIDLQSNSLAGRVDQDHTYYAINISGDGKQVYVGGAACDVATYDADSLTKVGQFSLPDGCGDQSTASFRIIEREVLE
jgi:quinohemoprotein amine dehydrogenase beta subunit